MKKRTVIAVIATLICIFASNKFWLHIEPVNINFTAAGAGKFKFEFELTDKKAVHELTLAPGRQEQTEVKIPGSISDGHFKIRVSPYDKKENTITISDLSIENGLGKITDYNKFSVNKELKPQINTNGFTLTLTAPAKALLQYKQALKSNAGIKFDINIFVIISILSFLLLYRLTSYLADFKTRKEHSRIDIIFVCLFFIILFIPMSKISKETKSKQENRNLAVFKPFIYNEKLNFNFGKDFNDWFSDRFAFRGDIISAYSKTIYSINTYYRKEKAFINKKTNWTFNLMDLAIFSKKNNFDISQYEQNLNRLKVFCSQRYIKLYILLIPCKEDIYSENIYPYFIDNENDFAVYLKEYIEKDLDIRVIYPKEALLKAKEKEYVFFKTDTHLTDFGVFTAYTELMPAIVKDFPEMKSFVSDDTDFNFDYNNLVKAEFSRYFTQGNTFYSLNLKDRKILDVKYKYFIHKGIDDLKIPFEDKPQMTREYYYPHGADKRVVVIGNSMSESLMEFLPYSFRYLKKFRFNNSVIAQDKKYNMLRFENNITEYKPDILIFCISSLAAPKIKDIYQ